MCLIEDFCSRPSKFNKVLAEMIQSQLLFQTETWSNYEIWYIYQSPKIAMDPTRPRPSLLPFWLPVIYFNWEIHGLKPRLPQCTSVPIKVERLREKLFPFRDREVLRMTQQYNFMP